MNTGEWMRENVPEIVGTVIGAMVVADVLDMRKRTNAKKWERRKKGSKKDSDRYWDDRRRK